MTYRFSNQVTGYLLVAVTVLGLLPAVAFAGVPGARAFAKDADDHNPAVFPPQSHPFGMSYGEWSARWWQWAFSLPLNHSPLFDTADCSTGQSQSRDSSDQRTGQQDDGGSVWFLGGAADGKPKTRSCTMPEGTALFFPMISPECSNLEGNGNTDADLRACAMGGGNLISSDPSKLYATLDSVPLTGLYQHRVQSPLFHFGPLPDDNFITFFCVDQMEGCPPAPRGSMGISVSDGIFLMLHPLPPGTHLLHFHAEIGTFIEDITYHLTVRR